jgi:hypothetical protein
MELIRADQIAGPLIGLIRGANMDSTADQPIVCTPKRYIIRRVIVTGASINLTAAVGGIYTGLSKSGTAIVPAAQVYTALTAPSKFIDTGLHASTSTDTFINPGLYLSLTTPQGAPATADIYIYGDAVEP